MTLAKPYPSWTTGVVPPSEVNATVDAIYAILNAITGSMIAAGTIEDANLNVSVSPVTRWDESLADFVASGFNVVASGLNCTVAAGIAYISGKRRVVAGTGHTVADSSTTYCDLSSGGTFSWNTNASPASGYLRLAKIVSSTTCTITDMRTLTPVGTAQIQADAVWDYATTKTTAAANLTASGSMADLITATLTDVKVGDILFPVATLSLSQPSADSTLSLGYTVGGSAQTQVMSENLFFAASNACIITAFGEAHTVAADAATLEVVLQWKTSASTTTANHRVIHVLRFRPTGP